MKKIAVCIVAVWVILTLTACGGEEETTEKHVSQQESQTTDVISGGSLEAVTSQTISAKEYLPTVSQKKDDEYEKKLRTGDYTWEKPLIVTNPYGNSPLTAYILFYTEDSCKVSVTVKGKTKATNVSGTVKRAKYHRVPVVGLYPNKENEVTLSCLDSKGKKLRSQTVRIRTSALPEKLKDVIRVEKKTKKSAYGLTIISGFSTKYPFAYDEEGDVRWYMYMTSGSYGVFPLSNKRFMFLSDAAYTPTAEKPHVTQMYEMDYMGRAYQSYYVKNGIHHEVIEKTPGGNLLVLSNSIDKHTEDVVIEIDRKTGNIVKSLDMREIFDDTYQDMVDWAHLNTASYKKEDGTILLSPRNVHAGIRVNWKTNELKWILANPKMFEGTEQEDKVLKPIGDITWHYQPHSIYELPYDLDGDPDTIHIMMYDNHWRGTRKVDFFDKKPESFVTVYSVNEKKMTVRQEKLYPGVKSIITSNSAYDRKDNRVFSFGGYLHPLVNGRQGMIYEFDYDSEAVLNQYSAKYYFYRGYELNIDWNDLAKPLKISKDYVMGTLQAPIATEEKKIPDKKIGEDKVSFYLMGSVLYMTVNDHAVKKVRFVGKNSSYVMDYSSAGKGGKKYRKLKYAIAVPLSTLKADTYEIAVQYDGTWYSTGKNVVRNN